MPDFELLSRLGRVLRVAIPTSRHAELVMDALELALGDTAIRTTVNGGRWVSLFRRDVSAPGLVYPVLVAQRSVGQLQGHYMNEEGVASNNPPSRKDDARPLRRELEGGELKFTDGNTELNVLYAEGGGFAEMCSGFMTERTIALCDALERSGQSAVENLADFISTLDLGAYSSVRVWYPDGTAGSPMGCRNTGLTAMRKALARGSVSADAQFLAVDACTGEVVATAPTRDEAIAICRAEILVKCPKRPPPPPMDHRIQEAIDSGLQIIMGPTSDEPPRSYAPEHIPIVVAELCALPDAPPPFGEWMRLLSNNFHSTPVIRRYDANNLLIVPPPLMRRTTLAQLEPLLDAADDVFTQKFIGFDAPTWDVDRPKPRYFASKFVVTQLPQGHIEVHCQSRTSLTSFSPETSEDHELGSSILRVRPVPDDDLP